jgi:hypothetical protein
VELLLMGHCLIECVLTNLPIEERHVGSYTARGKRHVACGMRHEV